MQSSRRYCSFPIFDDCEWFFDKIKEKSLLLRADFSLYNLASTQIIVKG